jgi:hypothetical protein
MNQTKPPLTPTGQWDVGLSLVSSAQPMEPNRLETMGNLT